MESMNGVYTLLEPYGDLLPNFFSISQKDQNTKSH